MNGAPDLLEYAQARVTLKRVGGAFVGPCPLCGGTDRFTIFKDKTGWLCRKCRPESGGVFDLIALCQGITVQEAINRGKQQYSAPAAPREPERKTDDADAGYLSTRWQIEANSAILAAEKAFSGSKGENYMLSRGFKLATLNRYRIGYDPKIDAVLVPWIGANEKIYALKYRYLAEDAKFRFGQKKGSRQVVFGANAKVDTDFAVICEGEMNAMSIHQATGWACYSAGGEANLRSILSLIQRVRTGVLWMDDAAKLERVANEVNTLHIVRLKSPRGQDANDVLRAHGEQVLKGVLERARSGCLKLSSGR